MSIGTIVNCHRLHNIIRGPKTISRGYSAVCFYSMSDMASKTVAGTFSVATQINVTLFNILFYEKYPIDVS